jgi:hypothetical protein
MSNKQEALNRLAQLEAEAKKLRETIEKVPGCPEPAVGQVYRHNDGSLHVVFRIFGGGFRLMCIRGTHMYTVGLRWDDTLFGGSETDFTYVGMIDDIATFNV